MAEISKTNWITILILIGVIFEAVFLTVLKPDDVELVEHLETLFTAPYIAGVAIYAMLFMFLMMRD